ncbi:putative transcription factor bZIP family [Helianthus debilis subsp. tardiflorus]
MASSSGKATSSGGSDEDLQRLMDQRKRNRMVSNRESARRSRLRKQKHLDELKTQLSQLREENNQVMATISVTMQHYTNVEAENLVLRAQVTELSRRLDSLNQIESFMSQPVDSGWGGTEFVDEFMGNSLSCVYANLPILAASDMIPY